MAGTAAHFSAELSEKLLGVRQIVPHLWQEGRAVRSVRDDHAVDARFEQFGEVRGGVVGQGDRLAEPGDFDFYASDLIRSNRWKTRILTGGLHGAGLHIHHQRLVGFERPDAAAQASAQREGDETGAVFCQLGAEIGGV